MIRSRCFFRVLVDQVLKLLGCDRALEKRLRLLLDDHVSVHRSPPRVEMPEVGRGCQALKTSGSVLICFLDTTKASLQLT